jgi:formylglycine-generating enzyme required for sulfatase activity
MDAGASRIFISYRREDTEHAAGRLAADLRDHFGREQVFEDITSIDPGVDFEQALQDVLKTCGAVLVVIGPNWVGVADETGRRRLDDPDDWVRREVEESLRRPAVRVFPILVGPAGMPNAEELPASLKGLLRRQAFPLTVRHWANDVALLVEHLERLPARAHTLDPAPPRPPGDAAERPHRQRNAPPVRLGRPRKAVAVAGVVVALIAAGVMFTGRDRTTSSLSSSTQTDTSPPPTPHTPDTAERATSPPRTPETGTHVEPGKTFRDCDNCPEMVVIGAGSFRMGSAYADPVRSEDEVPQRTVTISKPFALGRFEITITEWNVCVEEDACRFWSKEAGREPVRANWERAQTYVTWLARRTGKPYRLPSEAEWEYAARGGTTTRYPWGEDFEPGKANVWSGRNLDAVTYRVGPVGSFGPNAFGLHDMIGNFKEWVQDCWHDTYHDAPTNGEAWESGACRWRVLRGGGYYTPPRESRTASRDSASPNAWGSGEGFRVARAL